MDTEKIKIVLADDQKLFRKGVISILQTVEDFELIAEADNGLVLLEQLKNLPVAPDIALIDMSMPELNGIELNAILHKEYPLLRVLVVTVYDQQQFIIKMIESGASGYLSKNCDPDELITAIKIIYKTGFYFNEGIIKALQSGILLKNNSLRNINNIPIDLTAREKEVLQLICRELSNEEIAGQLFLSTRTVEGHRHNLITKSGCKNTAGLVIFAVKNGIYHIL